MLFAGKLCQYACKLAQEDKRWYFLVLWQFPLHTSCMGTARVASVEIFGWILWNLSGQSLTHRDPSPKNVRTNAYLPVPDGNRWAYTSEESWTDVHCVCGIIDYYNKLEKYTSFQCCFQSKPVVGRQVYYLVPREFRSRPCQIAVTLIYTCMGIIWPKKNKLAAPLLQNLPRRAQAGTPGPPLLLCNHSGCFKAKCD